MGRDYLVPALDPDLTPKQQVDPRQETENTVRRAGKKRWVNKSIWEWRLVTETSLMPSLMPSLTSSDRRPDGADL